MLAIHDRPKSFSQKWIEYCVKNSIHYKLVDVYSSNIINQISGCDGFIWHWAHHDYKSILFARQLTKSLEHIGTKVFPSTTTCWHFDDKVGQKYLLEAIGAPLVKSYVFYDRREALAWAAQCEYPKVFKLRGGAGAENVKLVRDSKAARKLIKIAFGTGFKPRNRFNNFYERVWQFRRDKTFSSFLNIGKGIVRSILLDDSHKNLPVEKNYIYFQDFVPANDHDIRIIVIGSRAFSIKRMVRDGDFRASGSGAIVYDPEVIPAQCIDTAFNIAEKLKTQSLAFDFVFENNTPKIVEISYAFSQHVYIPCPGYWDRDLNWIEGQFTPQFFMIEDFLKAINAREENYISN